MLHIYLLRKYSDIKYIRNNEYSNKYIYYVNIVDIKHVRKNESSKKSGI